MVLIRQINSPSPWEPGKFWFVEWYDEKSNLESLAVVRQVLNPAMICVQSVLTGLTGTHPQGVGSSDVAAAISSRWPHFGIEWTCSKPEDSVKQKQRLSDGVQVRPRTA
jgi:hypothetical protein